MKNEPNDALYKSGEQVFRQLEGFKGCAFLRRVRPPDRSGDMDFLLINRDPPMLGLVECEGLMTGKSQTRAPKGIDQIVHYVASFEKTRATPNAGKVIYEECILDAFDRKKKRGRENIKHWGSLENLWTQIGCSDEGSFQTLLDRAHLRLVPILLYYRKEVLRPEEKQVLAFALSRHDLYVGALRWQQQVRLFDGHEYVQKPR